MSMSVAEPTVALLPDGYQFRTQEIPPLESARVLYFAGLLTTQEDLAHYTEQLTGLRNDDKTTFIEVSVDRIKPDAKPNTLVGHGAVAVRNGTAFFCNLGVAPSAQNRGIGSGLLNERIRRVREVPKLRRIIVGNIAPTNTLGRHYKELGFRDDGLGGLELELRPNVIVARSMVEWLQTHRRTS